MHELQHLCELQDEADYTSQEEEVSNQTDQAFIDLLRSMWNEDDEGDDGTDTDGGRDDHRMSEEDQQSDDFTSCDKEISEEKVNEEELEEIYEFASTQRKRVEEEDSREDEEEKVNEEDDAFTNLEEPKIGSSKKSSNLKSQLEPDLSLDRSYSRLFSESCGAYEDEDPPTLPSTSGPSKTHPTQSHQHQSSHKPSSSKLSGRTLLQSSASVVDDFSLSPQPSTSYLPVPGLSPGQRHDSSSSGDKAAGSAELDQCVPFKRESQGPRSICMTFSPSSPQNKKNEPELIVLSDSSEEMNVGQSSSSPSPRSHGAVQKSQSYTAIKSQQIPKPSEDKESSSLELRHPGPEDCSPEVSWLIPSTPVQAGRSLRTNSTQTKSSMCRTQLFPKDDLSSPSSVFCSPVLSGKSKTSGGTNSLSKERLSTSPKRTSSCYLSKDRVVFSVAPSQVSHILSSTYSQPFQAPSNQHTPVHLQPQPYSSTPMDTDLHHPPGHLAASLLLNDSDEKKLTGVGQQRTTSKSPEKTELGSFNLSPLSVFSQPCPSSSHGGHERSLKHSKSSSESQSSTECSKTGTELKKKVEVIEIRNESRKGPANEGEQEEAKSLSEEPEGTEYSFQQSFMDEPPIAFNDSWGLDACADENPGCFSLRLEESGGSSKQEHSLGQGGATRSSSSNCQPPSSSHCIQSLTCESSSSKADTTPPPTTKQAHTSPLSTPPDPSSPSAPAINNSLLDSKIWDSWEEEEGEALPLAQRLNPSVQVKTPGKQPKFNSNSCDFALSLSCVSISIYIYI